MRFVRSLALSVLMLALIAVPAQAGSAPSITGGGSASDMTRFALAINNGQGSFECLMPGVMTVEARVTKVDSATTGAAIFEGTAQVTLSDNNPFNLPGGPMARGASFTTKVVAGGPGTGFVDLVIMGMEFQGTVEHGRISIAP